MATVEEFEPPAGIHEGMERMSVDSVVAPVSPLEAIARAEAEVQRQIETGQRCEHVD